MDRRAFLKSISEGIIVLAAVAAFTSYATSAFYEVPVWKYKHEKDPREVLREIYKEVVELGSYDKEEFIKREFHMNLDGNDENKEEHVVVLIHKTGDKEKMILQVTYFKPKRINSIIKYPKDFRVVLSYISGNHIEIKECPYNEKEMKSLFPEILQGIRNKKKLLKLIDRRK